MEYFLLKLGNSSRNDSNVRLLLKLAEKYAESELRDFELKSQAYKILLNGGYGIMGYRFAKYENLEAR